MRVVVDMSADLFNLVMHGEFHRATEKDFTALMEAFNTCTVLKSENYKPRSVGHWITNKEYIDKEFNGHYEGSCFNTPYNCSCCGYSPEDHKPNFCPNCGVKMQKGGTE